MVINQLRLLDGARSRLLPVLPGSPQGGHHAPASPGLPPAAPVPPGTMPDRP